MKRPPEDEAFPFEQIPRRIFLDTNVVDCLVKWGECVFDQQEPPADIPATLALDITSLTNILLAGRHTYWNIVISPKTIDELSETPDADLCNHLVHYGSEIGHYAAANGLTEEDHRYARELARKLIDSSFLSALPHASDRELISHAIALECDTFCTRDIRSIHRRRHQLRQIPLRILTPTEWWHHIRPWAALWM
jgi:hypothetical protein